jgi:CMP/dCMP kinase
VNRASVIAIDGAAGSGKSTLARGLARATSLPYLNTGLMYRALTVAALERGVDSEDEEELAALMSTLRFRLAGADPVELSIEGSTGSPSLGSLTSPEVEATVSTVSRHPRVRALMRDVQRTLGREGAVMEGRDIASVVFPEAPLKIYLVADPSVRARRRAAERPGERIDDALLARDTIDASVNAFEPQPDAVVIDTTTLDVDATVAAALEIVRARLPEVVT